MAEAISSDYDEMELSKAVKYISENAQDVLINKEEIKKLAEDVMSTLTNIGEERFYDYNNTFVRPFAYPNVEEDSLRKADWLFVLNTLNFSLWYPKGSKQWKVHRESGYFALCNAIERAIFHDKTPIWDPKYYTKITKSQLEHILRSDDGAPCIPLIDERFKILQEVGKILLKKYQGTFLECIKSSDYDADKLLKLLFDEFESYRDEVIYDGKKVRFLIKARSLVSDIWDLFKEKPKFNLNTKKMMPTILIDYYMPEFFLVTKVLRYSNVLVKRLENNNEPLEYGSREEIEIRGCSLFVAKEIYKEVHRISKRYVKEMPILKTKVFNVSVSVDNYLFDELNKVDNNTLKHYPFHYIKSVYY